MILDRALPAAGHDNHLFDPGSDRFLHHVLNQGLVDEREHLLRRRLGGRQKPGPMACRGNDHFFHRLIAHARPSFIAWISDALFSIRTGA